MIYGLGKDKRPERRLPMHKFSSIFGQSLQIFSRAEFYRTVILTDAEKGAKGFTCWQQFVARRSRGMGYGLFPIAYCLSPYAPN